MAKIDWKDAEGTTTSVERLETRGGPIYNILFNYEVDGHWWGGEFMTTDEYCVGDSIAVRYDPKNPEHNDRQEQDSRKPWVILGVVIILVLVVLWTVWH